MPACWRDARNARDAPLWGEASPLGAGREVGDHLISRASSTQTCDGWVAVWGTRAAQIQTGTGAFPSSSSGQEAGKPGSHKAALPLVGWM